jgi:hypothetical protein
MRASGAVIQFEAPDNTDGGRDSDGIDADLDSIDTEEQHDEGSAGNRHPPGPLDGRTEHDMSATRARVLGWLRQVTWE